jgi:TRAP-type C4-dicarboxylate transport system permease small subunit
MAARDVLWKALEILMVAILGVMVVLVFSNVIARYVFDAAITWAEEVSRFLFVWLTFVGASIGLHRGIHLGMDLVVARLTARRRLLVDVANHIIVLVFFAVWGFGGVALIEANLNYMSPATGFSMGLVYLIGPLAAILMGYETLGRLVGAVKALRVESRP